MINYFALPGLIKEKSSTIITSDEIVDIVCEVMNISVYDLKKRCRRREFALARFICFYFMREKRKATLLSIGLYFKMDHTTVIHGLSTLSDLMVNDGWLCHCIDLCNDKINRIGIHETVNKRA